MWTVECSQGILTQANQIQNGHLGSDFHKIRIVRGLIVIHTISKFEANRKKKTNFDESEMAATGGHLGSDSHQIQILLKLIRHIHYIQV